jgi:deoxyribodipyrimidine photo-lyase
VGLHEAGKAAEAVVPVFVFDTRILSREDVGGPGVSFMLECLDSLSKNLEAIGSRLIFRHGDPLVEIPKLVREVGAEAVFWNRDYEPDAIARDRAMEERGRAQGFATRHSKDTVFHEAEELRTGAGRPYVVFTPYARAWRARPKEPLRPAFKRPCPGIGRIASWPRPSLQKLGFSSRAETPRGGEKIAREMLRRFMAAAVGSYGERRDFPAIDGTSRLSPHLRFGTISGRTVFWSSEKARAGAKPSERDDIDTFVGELIWREFYFQILAEFPHVARGAFRPEYDALGWENDGGLFDAWREGRTGYPIVDAAMRQLNQTGWMHNRLRMIVAMFLTKDLLCDWRWGEGYFMRALCDGDMSANNGGWQWSAGTGTDAAPYFRIFAPVSQSQKFDPDGDFIRRFVPELAGLSAEEIHAPWQTVPLRLKSLGYPEPIVDHKDRRLRALKMYKAAKPVSAQLRGSIPP